MDFSLSSSLVGSAVSNPDKLALDLQFALDKTLTARKGPTPVFTRGSSATFIDSDGLVKYGPENLSLYSGAIDATIGWNLINATSSLSGSAPNGNAAYQVSEEATSLGHAVLNTGSLTQTNATPTISGITYTGSIFLKKVSGSINWVQVSLGVGGFGDAQYANFNIETGTVGNFAGLASGTSPQIVSFGDGWYRCSISVTANATISNSAGVFAAFINNTNGTTRLPAYLGSPSNSILASMCQLERSSTARTYIPTTTAAVYGPRFDHDPVTGVCKGLLMEEARTNSALQSNLFSTTPWGENSGTCGLSQNQIGPDGVTNSAWTFTDDNAASSEGRYQPISLVSGTTYTISAYVKKTTGTPSSFPALTFARAAAGSGGVVLDTTTGVVIAVTSYAGFPNIVATVSSINSGDYWRINATFVSNASASWDITLHPAFNTNGTGVQSITATGSAVYYGFQFETGSFPTSYIPTTTASVVRSADVCSITGSAFSDFYNQPEGTLFADVTPQTVAQTSNVLGVNTTTFSNGHIIYKIDSTFLTAGRRWGGQTTVGVTPQTAIATSTDVAVSRSRLAYVYKLNDFAFAYAGGIAGTDNLGTMPSPTAMRIGARDDGLSINGHLAAVRYYKKRLSNQRLQAITV